MNNLKTIRNFIGLSEKDLAKFLAINTRTYRAYENNKISIPTENIQILSKMYGITPNDLLNCNNIFQLPQIYILLNLTKEQIIAKLTKNLFGKEFALTNTAINALKQKELKKQ